jgi:polyisoprenyl-phosphate glycosyltransferase
MVSLVIPIFNEEEILPLLHSTIHEAMDPAGEEWEVVFVNDGSRDCSLALMLELQASDPHVVVVDLSRNWGHMGAINAGLRTARGDAIVLLDGDLQDPPALIPEMVREWRNGAQVVMAVRRSREVQSKLLGLAFHSFYRVLAFLSDYPIPLDAGIFSLMDRQALGSINSLREKNRFFPGLRAWVGYKTANVYYDRPDRAAGAGKLTLMSRFKYAADAITSFSYKPLRVSFALAGLSLFCAFGLAIGAATVTQDALIALLGASASVFVVGAMVLATLGILGEYIGRTYDEIRDRPLSIIRHVYCADQRAAARPAQPGIAARAPRSDEVQAA